MCNELDADNVRINREVFVNAIAGDILGYKKEEVEKTQWILSLSNEVNFTVKLNYAAESE